jgi:polysaccharide export outer membrane protein
MRFKYKGQEPRWFYMAFLLTTIISLCSSCVSRKEIEYFQLPEDSAQQSLTIPPAFEPLIQVSDLLEIRVTSINPEAAMFFNPGVAEGGTTANEGTEYLVDRDGYIEVPLVGKIKAANYSTASIRDTLRAKLEKYLQSPTVNVHFKNYKITILGEVKVPGVYVLPNEKATLPEVLGLAGDVTIYGDRKQVMVIREVNGKKEFGTLDLTTREVFTSPFYYLRPNDLIYIAPGKGRIASTDTFYRIAPLVISFLTLLTLIAVRFDVSN